MIIIFDDIDYYCCFYTYFIIVLFSLFLLFTYLSIYLSYNLLIYLALYLSINLSIYQSFFCLFLSSYLSVYYFSCFCWCSAFFVFVTVCAFKVVSWAIYEETFQLVTTEQTKVEFCSTSHLSLFSEILFLLVFSSLFSHLCFLILFSRLWVTWM